MSRSLWKLNSRYVICNFFVIQKFFWMGPQKTYLWGVSIKTFFPQKNQSIINHKKNPSFERHWIFIHVAIDAFRNFSIYVLPLHALFGKQRNYKSSWYSNFTGVSSSEAPPYLILWHFIGNKNLNKTSFLCNLKWTKHAIVFKSWYFLFSPWYIS